VCEKGFIPLFDGKTLNGWEAYKENGEVFPLWDSGFDVVDGCLHVIGDGQSDWLANQETFGDFTLRLEYKIVEKGNSGIFIRSPGPDWPAHKGFEIQVLDTYGDAPTSTSCGSIYGVLTPMRNMGRKPGEWNQVEITCRGLHVEITWNGFTVINADLSQLIEIIGGWNMAYADKPLKGHIGLQNHHSEVWYRNIRIKRLD